jgi:ketosteroid isomerase-like protein
MCRDPYLPERRSRKRSPELNVKASMILLGSAFGLMALGAAADDTSELIALDKAWGAAGTKGDAMAARKLLSDGLVSVSPEGITGIEGELAAYEPAPAGETYEATDYKVTFLDPNTAIMTHGVKGPMAHYSLHVWSKQGGKWKVVATSTTPADSD